MARSEAIRRIKDNLARYLAAGGNPVLISPHLQGMDKASRGLNHQDIGRLIIPAEDLAEWDADPDAYVDISVL